MKKGLVSIIIVNYNGKGLLKALVDSIKKSSFKNYEIIVADNSSSDGSQELVRKNYKNVKLVENGKNLGYSGINSALEHCNGEYILFLNNDMELDKDCIKFLVESINSDKEVAMAAPRLVNFYDRKLKSGGTWVSRAFYNGHIRGNGSSREIPYLGVGLIRKDFVDLFGYLFEPDYFIYAEDLDLGMRIRLSGKKAVFEPKAVMYHMHAVTTRKKSKAFTAFLMERNLLTTFFRIMDFRHIVLYLPYALLMRLIAITKDILSFQFAIAFARIKAVFYILFNFNKILEKRKEAQKFRKADDSYILKVFSEKYMFKPKFIV
ncbi:glycosyltransferase family 2 protein [Candidatus Woesearchaeota archaeon]|nr:glycosyltransferase family 2 protein [Candidatus Woesearchaeota archaeon]